MGGDTTERATLDGGLIMPGSIETIKLPAVLRADDCNDTVLSITPEENGVRIATVGDAYRVVAESVDGFGITEFKIIRKSELVP